MSLDVDKALHRAARLIENAELTAAETIYKDILTSFPKNSKALRGYQRMKSTDVVTRPEGSAPSPQQMQAVMALYNQGQFTEVLSKLDLLLEEFPQVPVLYNLQGSSRAALCMYSTAIDSFKQGLKLKPNDADIYFNMGNMHKKTGAWDTAILNYESGLKIKPDFAGVYINLGSVQHKKGDIKAAIESYKQALKIKPDYAEAYTNRAHAFLKSGDFALGWQDYEWRWKKSKLDSAPLTTDRPVWQPQTAGRVLLWSEQGVGDMIMFASIIPELYECSEQVIVQTDARLIPLFRRAFPRDIVYYDHTEIIAENRYDSHIPMGSLPRYFRPDLASFQKASGAYLKPDAARAARLRQNLLGATGQSLCGISWRGGKEATSKARRSIALNQLAQALAAQNVTLVNLQYGAVDDELQALKRDFGISVVDVSEIDKFYDLDGLAALISACDHIVSIDNVTVHLAGALGQATRVLLPFACDWRWGQTRPDSYWYSAVRLLRQQAFSDWQAPLRDLGLKISHTTKPRRIAKKHKAARSLTRPERSAPSSQQMQAVMALCHQGQFIEVLSKLDLLLEAFPDASAVYNLQGASRAALGRYDGAVDSFKRAIKLKPDDASSYFNIGNVQKETGAFDAAIANYDSALKIKPDHVAALRNKGNVLQDKGDAGAAIASYKSAIEIEPKHALTHYQMGVALQDLGDLKAAVDCYKQALRIKPDDAAAYNNMGNAQKDTGDTAAAIDSYKQAIKIKPDYVQAYNNMGNALYEKGDTAAAIDSLKKALKINPNYAEIYSNMGHFLAEIGQPSAAIDSFKQALKIKPDYAEAYTNRAHAFLKSGDFALGWQDYEWRWKKSKLDSAPLTTDRPVWQPQTAGRVLLWSEQGVGDMIMFASIIPELYECSEQVIVQTDARLIPLFRRAFPRDIVYYDHTEIIAENRYDSHIPMGSLPRYFRPDLASFQKASGAYLKPDAARAARLRQNLLGATGQSLCGISWRGGKEATSKARRSIALNQLAQALAAQNVTLVNLQYGAVDDELQALKRDFGISVVDVSEIDKFYDLDGLAALISACDHIVSIDNVTVHLAGALGQATRVLLPFACDWRWMVDRSDSPWYPKMTLYRQKIQGDWAGVLEAIKQDLRVMR